MTSLRKIERKRKKIERIYERRMALVLASQLSDFQRGISNDPLGAIERIDKYFSKGIEEVYEKLIRRVANDFRNDQYVRKDSWTDAVNDRVATIGGLRIKELIAYSKKYVLRRLRPILMKGISDGLGVAEIGRLIVKDIGEYKLGFSRYRSERIVRTEVVSSSNWASLETVKQSGVRLMKIWITELDGRERETHREANNQKVGLDEKFLVRRADGGYDEMEYPSDPSGSAGNVINCRCSVGYARVEN